MRRITIIQLWELGGWSRGLEPLERKVWRLALLMARLSIHSRRVERAETVFTLGESETDGRLAIRRRLANQVELLSLDLRGKSHNLQLCAFLMAKAWTKRQAGKRLLAAFRQGRIGHDLLEVPDGVLADAFLEFIHRK